MVILCLYTIFCVLLARHDALAIYKDKRISHDRNGMLHGIFFAVMLFICLFTHAWLLLAAMPFIGRVVFDVALNRMRKLPWDYVSPWLHSQSPAIRRKVSYFDRVEYKVFKSGATPKIVYAIIITILITIHYVTQ